MIKSINIQGFQSHVHTCNDLAPGLTVITGATDSGKTAIIRAIRWLAFGEPAGDAFINANVGEASVEVELDSGIKIKKSRKGNKTLYQVMAADGCSGETYESAAVPKEVTDLIGIEKQTFGDIEAALNFAYQLEAPFLISLPASAGAKVLGKIAGTEVVDLAVKDVAKDTYAARQEISQANKAIERIDSDLGQYADLESIRRQLEACEMLIGQLDEKSAMFQALTHLKKMYQISFEMISQKEKYLQPFEKLQDVETALHAIDVYSKKTEKCRTLTALQMQCTETIDQKQRILLQLDELEKAGAAIGIIEEAILRLDTMTKLGETVQKLSSRIEAAQAIIGKTDGLSIPGQMLSQVGRVVDDIQHLQVLQIQKLRSEKLIENLKSTLKLTDRCVDVYTMLKEIEETQKKLSTLQNMNVLSKAKENMIATSLVKDRSAAVDLEQQKKELDALWADIDVCPLCEQPIVKGVMNHGH